MGDSDETIRQKVTAESDGYREAVRRTEVEVLASERDVPVPDEREAEVRKEARKIRRIVSLIAMSPLALGWLILYATTPNNEVSLRFFAMAIVLVGAVAYGIQYIRRQRMLNYLRDTMPRREPQAKTKVRPKQSLTLVGRAREDGRGEKRDVLCVRVVELPAERNDLRVEYDDGSTDVLLEDLSDDEVSHVQASLAEHDIPCE